MDEKALQEAMAEGRCGELHRSIEGTESLRGYIAGAGARWVLLQAVSDHIFMNGFIAVRVEDVAEFEPLPSDFVERALAAFGEERQDPTGIDLDTDEALVRTLGGAFGLVAVHVERDDPDVCFIGLPRTITTDDVGLLEVTPAGEWEDEVTAYSFEDLTRVDAGARYERGLGLVAGKP